MEPTSDFAPFNAIGYSDMDNSNSSIGSDTSFSGQGICGLHSEPLAQRFQVDALVPTSGLLEDVITNGFGVEVPCVDPSNIKGGLYLGRST